jgi:hypothetical protein
LLATWNMPMKLPWAALLWPGCLILPDKIVTQKCNYLVCAHFLPCKQNIYLPKAKNKRNFYANKALIARRP